MRAWAPPPPRIAGVADKIIGAPFGGYKKSGFGRTVSPDAIREYTQVKAVILDSN